MDKRSEKHHHDDHERCVHESPVYQAGEDSVSLCREPAEGQHEGKWYCHDHLRYHATVKGRVSWDEYSEDGTETYGSEDVDLHISGDDEEDGIDT